MTLFMKLIVCLLFREIKTINYVSHCEGLEFVDIRSA